MPRGPKKLKWGARRLRLAIDAASVALWSWNVDADNITMDGRAFAPPLGVPTICGTQPSCAYCLAMPWP
jgi:hypothetical protein